MTPLKDSEMELGIWNGGSLSRVPWPVVYRGEFSVWFLEHHDSWGPYVVHLRSDGGEAIHFRTLEDAKNLRRG